MSLPDVKTVLPQREPFLFIDRVVSEHKEGEGKRIGWKIAAERVFSDKEYFFEGHFPGEPILPAVILTEAMAQAAILAAYRPPPEGKKWNYRLAGVKNAKYRREIKPGEKVMLDAEIVRDRGEMLVIEVRATVDGQKAGEAEITAMMYL
jgi:3-hydroxyacyl-[acyl-carrier-protein] dehydratase